VSMNLLDHRVTPIPAAYDCVAEAAAQRGVAIERGELVGLAPHAAFAGRAPASVGLSDFTRERELDFYLERVGRCRRHRAPSGTENGSPVRQAALTASAPRQARSRPSAAGGE